MLELEEGEDLRAIVTPDLRLAFRWSGDRWSHAIEIRPGPWRTLASADEWTEADGPSEPRPTYEQLHFQRDGKAILALAVGQAGHHHYSASFRVSYHAWRQTHFRLPEILQDRSTSLVMIDVADRCRSHAEATEARYRVHAPPVDLYLGDSEDDASDSGWTPKWRSWLVWEASVKNNYDVAVWSPPKTSTARVAIRECDDQGWSIRVAPTSTEPSATRRFHYAWGHNRVSAFHKNADDDVNRPWTMTMEPGNGPPEWTYLPDGPQNG